MIAPNCGKFDAKTPGSSFLSTASWVSAFVHLVILPLILLSGNDFCPAFGQEYSVAGRLEVSTKVGTGDKGKITEHRFYIEVVGDRYKIRIHEAGNDTNYHEYALTNGSMFTLHHVKSSETLVGGSLRKATTNDVLPFPAAIEDRAIPAPDGSRAQFVWFAYASSRFFASVTNNLMPPFWSPEDPQLRKQPFDMLTFFDLTPTVPNVPNTASFVNDGFYRSYNPATKRLDVIRLTSPYDHGYTNAHYQVLATTNLGNIVLPSRFEFVVYSSPIMVGAVPFERIVVRGTAVDVSNLAPENASIPNFAGIASVVDYRQAGSAFRSSKATAEKFGPKANPARERPSSSPSR